MNFKQVGNIGFKFFREITTIQGVVKNINVTYKSTYIVKELSNV